MKRATFAKSLLVGALLHASVAHQTNAQSCGPWDTDPVPALSSKLIASGGGVWVMFGTGNTGSDHDIVLSYDLKNWIGAPHPPVPNRIDSVAWGDGAFVGVSGGGEVVHSTNGFDWILVDDPDIPSFSLRAVTWGNSMFVAVGSQQKILVSPDGLDWEEADAGSFGAPEFRDVTWGASGFVAVGLGGAISSSPDGLTWAPRVSGTSEWLNSVGYSGGTYLTVLETSDSVLTSPDGIFWTPQPQPPLTTIHVLAGDGPMFVARGSYVSSTTFLFSSDGVTWTQGPITSGLASSAYQGETIALLGSQNIGSLGGPSGGVTYEANEQGQWMSKRHVGAGVSEPTNDLIHNGEFFIKVGGSGPDASIATGIDGKVWTTHYVAEHSLFEFVNSVAATNSGYVAVGADDAYWSADGFDWIVNSIGSQHTLWGVAFGNGLIVAVGGGCSGGQGGCPNQIPCSTEIWTSTNGIDWDPVNIGIKHVQFDSVTWRPDPVGNGGLFVAVGRKTWICPTFGDEIVATSPNGTDWTLVTVPDEVGTQLKHVIPDGPGFMAAGFRLGFGDTSPVILRSPDGLSWSRVNPNQFPSSRINKIVRDGVGYYAVAMHESLGYGIVFSSSDGETWSDDGFPILLGQIPTAAASKCDTRLALDSRLVQSYYKSDCRAPNGPILFCDGFGSGGREAWSSSIP